MFIYDYSNMAYIIDKYRNISKNHLMKILIAKINTNLRFIMNDFVFADLKSLSENDHKNIIKIDNDIPSEFDPAWKPNDNDFARRLKFWFV